MVRAETYLWPRWLCLRALAVGFLAAFFSLRGDIQALIGPRGLLPAGRYLAEMAELSSWWQRPLRAPTLLWLNSSPAALDLLCWTGLAAAAALLLNLWPRLSLFLCWLLYLSFVSIGNAWSNFQSDEFLLESALLLLFVAPAGLRPGLGERSPPRSGGVFLIRWLTFRLMFESGMGKILSKDPSWRSLSIEDYFQCNPFPTWLSWLMYQAPRPLIAASAALALAVEIPGAWLIWLGRRPRIAAFIAWAGLQAGIVATGSYHFINYNAIAVALFLLDDRALAFLVRRPVPKSVSPRVPAWRGAASTGALALLFYSTFLLQLNSLGLPLERVPGFLRAPLALTAPLRSANRYQCYIVISHDRGQIEFEGSRDGGATWRPYKRKWDPWSFAIQAPLMPRFDWHLYYAALGDYRSYPLVLNAAEALINGNSPVVGLFAGDPFPEGPPGMIRFPYYNDAFTDRKELKRTGAYWNRRLTRYYAPIVYRDPKDGAVKVASAESRSALVHDAH